MDIYRNSAQRIYLDAPAAALREYAIKSPGRETQFKAALPGAESNQIAVDIALEDTLIDGEIDVSIRVGGVNGIVIHEYIDVVTPLFKYRDVAPEVEKETYPELERLVRHVIEAYTGRSFGKTIERHVVDSGSNVLQFSQPLIEFRGISDRYVTHTTTLSPPKMPYEVFNDGFGLAIDWAHYDIKSDSMWILDRKCPKHYVVEGTFGYHNVPADVKQAALLIAGMWGCDQAVWRDRYIQTMRSSDWSVTYSDRGFEKTTGSVTADLLLDKYSRKYVPGVI